ncbi:MAG: tRNA (adenosine(37)-N6)-threonylcarbamoyltransferase complex ATPase subunit type 1 TsaE [Planctomycetota bacterium]|jgi:tRNA threonylcarbamoyladenosine biosynthesis protein TsaE
MNTNRENHSLQITSHSPDETMQIGAKIASALKGGEIIALIGPLGSGKTHLVKGLAAGLGEGDTKLVNSPTFVLINEYADPGMRLSVYHIDAYRLESIAEFEMLGFDDLCRPDSVVLIEWADKVRPALENIDTIEIELSHIDQNQRQILLRAAPEYILDSLR